MAGGRSRLGSHLEWNGPSIRLTLAIPRDLQGHYGKTRIKVPLRTDSPKEADVLKLSHIADFKAEFALLRSTPRVIASPVMEAALRLREDYLGGKEDRDAIEEAVDVQFEKLRGRPIGYEEDEEGRPEPVFAPDKEALAKAFGAVALGRRTPPSLLVDEWLREGDRAERTEREYRRAIARLETWGTEAGCPVSVETFRRKDAGAYVSGALSSLNRKTANKYISALSSFWKWLASRGHIEEDVRNPWEEQSFDVGGRKGRGGPRPKVPFNDEQVAALLANEAARSVPRYLPDLMRIAAFSGMRIEEIANLKVRDCADGRLKVREGKTDAAVRDVPLHSQLVELVAGRRSGKDPDAWLFHELPDRRGKVAQERSAPATKAFTRYRRALGVDDVLPGRRQSRLDFHSFRRWFAMKARDALSAGATGYREMTIAVVMGHKIDKKALGLTLSHYAGEERWEAKRACMEAVKLPGMAE